jgi:hypothetical protein
MNVGPTYRVVVMMGIQSKESKPIIMIRGDLPGRANIGDACS